MTKLNGTTATLATKIAEVQKCEKWIGELREELRGAEAKHRDLRGELAAMLGVAPAPRVSRPSRATKRRRRPIPKGSLSGGIVELVAQRKTIKQMARALKTTTGSVCASLSTATKQGKLVRVARGQYAVPPEARE